MQERVWLAGDEKNSRLFGSAIDALIKLTRAQSSKITWLGSAAIFAVGALRGARAGGLPLTLSLGGLAACLGGALARGAEARAAQRQLKGALISIDAEPSRFGAEVNRVPKGDPARRFARPLMSALAQARSGKPFIIKLGPEEGAPKDKPKGPAAR